jgi:uncharacterized protein YjaZ
MPHRHTPASLRATALLLLANLLVAANSSGQTGIQVLQPAAEIIELLEKDSLSPEKLIGYFEHHRDLLRNNIGQSSGRHGRDDLRELAVHLSPQFLEQKERILHNRDQFKAAQEIVVPRLDRLFGTDIPRVVLVPCLGLFSSNGWADYVDGAWHVFVALESATESGDMAVLLAHEVAHTILDLEVRSVLDQFYNEGFATYVSSVVCPGLSEETYLFGSGETLAEYLLWAEDHRIRIATDARAPFEVLNDQHKFYFSMSYSPYPRIGYLIGFRYLRYLHGRHPLHDLRTFAVRRELNQEEFTTFLTTTGVFSD